MSQELPQAGHRIGRYVIEKLLGQGGMGAVFAATNEVTGRAVALKWMLPSMAMSADHVSRFLAEARATARIEHPNVIQIIDVGQDGPAPFLVMERLRGRSLGEHLGAVGRMSVAETLKVMIPACRGIAEAHSEGIIHRDLKPDNIFLCEGKDGSSRPPKVLDFGISKLFDDEGGQKLTQTGAIMGTPLYMSPEQIRAGHQPDPTFDIYAIGVVLYECLAGRPPFGGETLFGLLQDISVGNVTPLRSLVPDVPEPVAQVVHRAMHVRREQRPQTMTDLVAELEGLQRAGYDNPGAGGPATAGDGQPPTGPITPGPYGVPPTYTPSGPYPAPGPLPPTGAGASPPTGSVPGSAPANAPPPANDSSTVLYVVVGLVVVLLAVLGAGIAFVVSRTPATPVATPTPTSTPAPIPGVPAFNNAQAPDVSLRFGGRCAPTFMAPVLVIPSGDTVTLSSTQGFRLAGNMTVGLPPEVVAAGRVELSTRQRLQETDGATALHLMHDQRMWMNIAHDAGGVLTGDAPDPVHGTILIRSFDAERGVMDLTFQNVTLQASDDTQTLCTIDGTLRTYGSTNGM
ncbi:MAG: hypothetical protein CMN30_29475 [Sandaracinus sp.]|nr:hypothetical protein [Sandaracinus sp.]